MKAAIITWITYNNFGTELQAFALKKAIQEFCEECVIISDRPVIESMYPYMKKIIDKNCSQEKGNADESGVAHLKNIVNRYATHPKAIIQRIKQLRKIRQENNKERAYTLSQEAFEVFKKNRLDVLQVESVQDYPSLNEQFDVFVCGSDQIWSMLPRNFNPFYFLDFVKKKKIAYAPSIGSYRIEDNDKETLRSLLNDFSAVSLRERISAEQFSDLLQKKVFWTLDPTLLHDMHFWERIAAFPKIKRPFLLCYFLENKEWYFSYARDLSRALNLKVVLIPSKKQYANRDETYDKIVGPEEFVGLFCNASFVLTDSYHGSIFSLIFNKSFLYLKRFSDSEPYNQNVRVDSLFKALGIFDRIIDEEKGFDLTDVQDIDYDYVNIKLEELRKLSKDYLRQALEK